MTARARHSGDKMTVAHASRVQGWLAVVAALLCAAFLALAGSAFPSPFFDEGYFVPPAMAWSQSASFWAPELDPNRALHWMPVGHFVLAGSFVKLISLIGGSGLKGLTGLAGVRLFSSLAFALTLLVLAALTRRLHAVQAWCLLLPFVTLPLLTLARLARMESLFLLVVMLCLWALLRRREGWALGLALLSGLVHPNGVFVCVAVAVCLAHAWRTQGWATVLDRIQRDRWPLALCALLAAAYGAYELLHWADFLTDMRFQMARKARHFDWRSPFNLACLVLVSASAGWAGLRGGTARVALMAIGASLVVCRLVGQETWYTPGCLVGVAMLVASWWPLNWPGASSVERRSQPVWLGMARHLLPWLGGALLPATFVLSVFVIGWHGARLPWPGAPQAAVLSRAQLAQAVIYDLRQRSGGVAGVGVSCAPWFECVALWGPLREAGFVIRLSNPVTQPAPGQFCVAILRERPVHDADAAAQLYRGGVTGFAIEPCEGQWRWHVGP